MVALTFRKYRGPNAIRENLEPKIIHVVDKSMSPRQDATFLAGRIYVTSLRVYH
jgi:hypothetical protein